MDNHDSILQNLDCKNYFEIQFFENDTDIDNFIKAAIGKLFDKYSQKGLGDITYFCTKEMVSYAIQSNAKRAFFEKHNLNINNMGEYITGIRKFKAILENHEINSLSEHIRKNDLWVKFGVNYSQDGICLQILNNTAIAEFEEKNIRLRLRKYMAYQDKIDFLVDDTLHNEIADLGIAMIVVLMKKAMLDPGLFRIGNKDGKTLSRIEIGMNDRYKPIRKDRACLSANLKSGKKLRLYHR